LIAAAGVLLAAVLGYALTRRSGASGGSGGENSLEKRWDHTGSHPLPNEGVERAP